MKPKHKLITMFLWAGVLLVMVGVVVAKLCKPSGKDLPHYYPAAAFVLTDQQGHRFSNLDLAGHPYIAAFIFTRCASSCPIVSARMAQLQNQIPASVHLVSFSVDPTYDTPAVLEKYALSYRADESRWHFLTGAPSAIADAAAAMKLSAPPPGPGDQPIVHSDRLLLVDAAGDVRGIYDSGSVDSVKRLAADARALAGWSLLP